MNRREAWFMFGLCLVVFLVFIGMLVFALHEKMTALALLLCMPSTAFLSLSVLSLSNLWYGRPGEISTLDTNKEYALLAQNEVSIGRHILILRDDEDRILCIQVERAFSEGTLKIKKRRAHGGDKPNFQDEWQDAWVLEPVA